MARSPSIGQYLLEELHRLGVRHIFGVPGDYVLRLCGLIEKGPIRYVNTTREDSAGLAADAYARVRGLGVACITYCVGGLNCANAIAGAYAEKSPVLLISGAPGLRERLHNPLLHHRVRGFDTQLRIYREMTVASAALEDARKNTRGFSIIDAHLDPYDTSTALRRLGERLGRRVKGKV